MDEVPLPFVCTVIQRRMRRMCSSGSGIFQLDLETEKIDSRLKPGLRLYNRMTSFLLSVLPIFSSCRKSQIVFGSSSSPPKTTTLLILHTSLKFKNFPGLREFFFSSNIRFQAVVYIHFHRYQKSQVSFLVQYQLYVNCDWLEGVVSMLFIQYTVSYECVCSIQVTVSVHSSSSVTLCTSFDCKYLFQPLFI